MLKPLTVRILAGGLNISSSQPQPQPLDNRTIQDFVKDYVDDYVGRFIAASHFVINGSRYLRYYTLINADTNQYFYFL